MITSNATLRREGRLPSLDPDAALLRRLFKRRDIAQRLVSAPGGWRTLSHHELEVLKLNTVERQRVLALQELVSRGFAQLEVGRLTSSGEVARVYGARLAGHVTEVMVAVGLDGQNNVRGEVFVAIGGSHGLSVTARDVLRPLVRMGASAFILVHNHPSGDPTPSREDVSMTKLLARAGEVVGITLVDHVIVAARRRGHASLLDLGFIETEGAGSSPFVAALLVSEKPEGES